MRRTRRYTITLAVAGMLLGATPAPAVNHHPTSKDAKRWVRAWCKAQPGWSRAHVRKVMGSPTLGLAEQDQWDSFGYHFTAFMDEDGRARQLQFNASMLSSSQRKRLRCDAVRTYER